MEIREKFLVRAREVALQRIKDTRRDPQSEQIGGEGNTFVRFQNGPNAGSVLTSSDEVGGYR